MFLSRRLPGTTPSKNHEPPPIVVPGSAGRAHPSQIRGRPSSRPNRPWEEQINPRVRGEPFTRAPKEHTEQGSPPQRHCGEHLIQGDPDPSERITPRVYGEPCQRSPDGPAAGGTIPASAESTGRDRLVRPRGRDQPRRVREACSPSDRAPTGSSPPTRGRVFAFRAIWLTLGSSPHSAGSTDRGRADRSRRWDHPRVRGEQPKSAQGISIQGGSSPRLRRAHCMTCGGIPRIDDFRSVCVLAAGCTHLEQICPCGVLVCSASVQCGVRGIVIGGRGQ